MFFGQNMLFLTYQFNTESLSFWFTLPLSAFTIRGLILRVLNLMFMQGNLPLLMNIDKIASMAPTYKSSLLFVSLQQLEIVFLLLVST